MTGSLAWLLALFFVPTVLVGIDIWGGLRSHVFRIGRHRRPRKRLVARTSFPPIEDFEVVVPIWGSIDYLVNVGYLASYGQRVVLCAPEASDADFKSGLTKIAAENDFRIYWGRSASTASSQPSGRRQTSGVVRDELVRNVHEILTAPFVVCIDADTVTSAPLNQLVGQLAAEGFDLVSVRVIPANADTWLGRIQAHEYRMAMRLRTMMPWMVSGACHAGRREAHRRIMACHTLFFQGNDVELGVIATKLGMNVGHVLFDVPTEVPDNLRAWWRQRYAWSGGEFRLFFMNPQISFKHPFLWIYGALITFAGAPLRWNAVLHADWTLAGTAVIYGIGLAFMHRGHWDRWLPLLPLYTFVSSLVLVPLGALSYVRMVQKHRNVGLIRVRALTARTATLALGAQPEAA